jgi:peroxiredoxin
MEQNKKKIDWIQLASFALIVLLTVETGLLIRENKKLKATLAQLAPAPLNPGERVEPFKIESLDGIVSDFTYSDPHKKYLLFVFSTSCSHCENTIVYWQHIAAINTDGRCSILGVSLDTPEETKKYAAAKKLTFSVVADADTNFERKYKLAGVPSTILVRGDGVVERSWYGELSAAQSDDIEHLMNVRSEFTN